MAAGAIRSLLEAGLRVPEDVAIVGFDDIPLASRTTPQLTTIRQPIARMGSIAVNILLEMIDRPSVQPHRIILPTELVIRSSCGAVLIPV
jgi:LacI family transcriptional regulator